MGWGGLELMTGSASRSNKSSPNVSERRELVWRKLLLERRLATSPAVRSSMALPFLRTKVCVVFYLRSSAEV